MKKPIIITLALAAAFTGATLLFSFRTAATTHATDLRNGTPPKGCVFKTVYEGEGLFALLSRHLPFPHLISHSI